LVAYDGALKGWNPPPFSGDPLAGAKVTRLRKFRPVQKKPSKLHVLLKRREASLVVYTSERGVLSFQDENGDWAVSLPSLLGGAVCNGILDFSQSILDAFGEELPVCFSVIYGIYLWNIPSDIWVEL
jgi:hypothetical protein